MKPAYPARLSLAQLPTPLQPLDRFSALLGGPRIWLKRDDLTGSLCTGNKVRKLEFIFAHALAEAYDSVISCGGLQSNHCRATAVLAAQLGLRCVLVLRGEQPAEADGNLLLARLAGADIRYIPVQDYQQQLPALLEHERKRLAKAGSKALVIPTGGSDGLGVWGYIAAAGELQQDFRRLGIAPRHIVHASGSGGTQAGLMLGAWLHGLDAGIVGINVCDDYDYFAAKIRQDIDDWQQRYGAAVDWQQLSFSLIDGYVGEGYGQAGQPVLQCIAELARTEGVILDPVYSGKAFSGLCQEIRNGRFAGESDLVFIHTGGIYGLYAFRDSIQAVL